MADLQTMLATIDTLGAEELEQLYRHIESRRRLLFRARNSDPKRQTQEAIRIRQEVNAAIDEAIDSAKRHLAEHAKQPVTIS
jgi:hypothetical protein